MFKKLLAIVLSVSMLLSIFIPGTFATSSDSDSATSQLTLETQPTDPQPTETSAPAVVICGNCGAEGHEANICPACPECKQTAAHAEGCSFNTVSVTSDTAPQPCTTCGVVGCTSGHENWCTICLADNCGQTHVMCANCGSSEHATEVCPACPVCKQVNGHTADCVTTSENWCTICKMENCGKDHTACANCGSDQHATEVCPACPVCKQVNGHTEDCVTTSENWCTICKMENCGKDHTACANCGSSEHNTEVCPACPECKQVENHAADCSKALASVDDTETEDLCPYCDETVAEDGTVIHDEFCNAAYAYDGSNDVGKYAKFNEAYGSCFVYGSADTGDDLYVFEYSDFMEGTVVSISGWHWDYRTTALLYKVSFYSGGVKDEYAAYWPAEAWLLQRYTDYADSNALTFVTPCAVCGVPGCTTNHKPITDAVIPDVPTLTPGADVSLVDAYGNPITGGAILRIREGTKFSMSAWTGLTDVGDETYKWQISADETGGAWVSISGQTTKGLLTSMAMFNTFKTLPSIRCEITTGGVKKYSQAISVAPLKEDTRVDSASSVSVSGWLPIDANLNVTPQTPEQAGLAGKYDISDVSVFNDITLMRGGSVEYQPEDGDYLTIVYPESVVLASGLKVGDTYQIYHINGDDVYVSEEMVYNGGDIVMTFDKLSVFGFSKTVASGETDECPLCGAAPAADGTVTHAADCNMQYSVDASHHVGVDHVFNFTWQSAFVYPTRPEENFNHLGSSLGFSYFGMNPIVKVVDWHWDPYTTALWYQVAPRDGETLPTGLANATWVYVDCTNPAKSEGYALVPVDTSVIGKTATIKVATAILGDSANSAFMRSSVQVDPAVLSEFVITDIYSNGNQVVFYVDAVPGTTWPYEGFHFVDASDVQLKADEPIIITKCAICHQENCTTAHMFCPEHLKFDCDLEHEIPEPIRPITGAVQPSNPVYTAGAAVSVTDADGNAVNASTGLALQPGMRSSLWAFGNGGAYQWQIQYNGEWVDIEGQTSPGLVISPAMLFNNSSATIRCQVTSGESVVASQAIPVYVDAGVSAASVPAPFGFARAASLAVPAAEDDTPALKEYSVVINYVFENNVVVADPYTATLAAGSNFSATVTNPTIMGYLPYVNDEPSESVKINITNIQAGVTYTVTYKPANVNYTVIHYCQNIDNDKYTIYLTETKQGLTKSVVPEVVKPEELDKNFYALRYERPEIAANGSTVVEVYYDRNYGLMLFDLGDGGYGVEPIYARYGAPVAVGTPTRPGYTFDGWDPTLPTTVPVGVYTYTAKWTVGDEAEVKVVIWGENPNDEEYSYLTTGELKLKPGTSYTYNGTDTLYLYCEKEAHTHSATCGITCGKEEHTNHDDSCLGRCTHPEHNIDCYNAGYFDLIEVGANDLPNGLPPSPVNNRIYETQNWYNQTLYYLYVGGKWYCSSEAGWIGQGTQRINLSCSHSHTDDCYSCVVHSHTDSCYSCGKEVHVHDSNCQGTVAGLDSKLWKFVKSDTVTVEADGSSVINVYYDRVSYNVEFHRNQNCTNEYTTLRITAKWGESIVDDWPRYDGSSSWLVQGKSNTWQNGILIMPVGGAKFWGPKSGNNSYKAYYYVEALPGVTDTITHNGVTYVLHHTDTSVSSGNVTDEERYAIEGFTFKEGTANGTSYNNAKFYYVRHKYAIEFHSPTSLLKKTENVYFEAPLNSYNWTPDPSDAPIQYEPGSVVFEGWYLNPECTGDKFDFTTQKMPVGSKDGDTTLTLYAKWVPVTHDVEFYLDKNELDADTSSITDTHPTLTVPHGSKVPEDQRPAEPDNGDYTFVGWFYMDGNTEKAFDFDNMPVTKDLKVYAKWSSKVLKEYFVYFKIQGTDTQIADPITGSGLAGITKTFDAKGGTDLYVGYQEGYFPLTQSHSMTIDIEDDSKNIFTFWYVQKEAVPYTVYYVAETLKEGGTSLGTIERNGKTYHIIAATKAVNDNRQAVVTEKFEVVPGYMPDAYQKRLVVDGTDGAENEIIFFYAVDTVHAYYKVTHYTQNTNGVDWTVYDERQFVGEIGQTYSADPLTIDGFTYDPNVVGTVDSGKLTADGLELKLYYTRNSYPYEVRYLEQGTGKQLADPKTGIDLYGKVLSESAREIANYTAVDPTSQTLTIKIVTEDTPSLNIITFYYVENEVTINYVPVGPDGAENFGTVTPTSEDLKVLSADTASGSTANPGTNFRFIGWFEDETCTGDPISTDPHFVPKKPGDVWVEDTYYAKFEYDLADLTITKSGWQSIDENQSFVFYITGTDERTEGVKALTVVIHGNGSATIKDLPVGNYSVVEQGGWSWRYTGSNAAVELKPGGSTVSISNSRKNIPWLSGDGYAENQFTVTEKPEK